MKVLSGSVVQGAASHFNLSPEKPLVFVMGGSLGAVSMNSAVKEIIDGFTNSGSAHYSILWQCGERYLYENTSWLSERVEENPWLADSIKCLGFIDRMDLAYSAANLIASRAGAMSISELALVAKPTILIPSPHVAEDHQTKNALSLVNRDAALMIVDKEVVSKLGDTITSTLSDTSKTNSMCKALREASSPEACSKIVDEIESLLKSRA
jgi:UDP-N-acetylglucosamine--N-acetylmuramyl-(pentapeptide) pyrophosphoryl-undecaprenol N-acetylglucosamine transferase